MDLGDELVLSDIGKKCRDEERIFRYPCAILASMQNFEVWFDVLATPKYLDDSASSGLNVGTFLLVSVEQVLVSHCTDPSALSKFFYV